MVSRLYPMARARTVTSPLGTRMRYSPRSFVRTPICAPTTPIVASVTGEPLPDSVTFPVISRVCAMTVVGANARATTSDARVGRTEAPRWREIGALLVSGHDAGWGNPLAVTGQLVTRGRLAIQGVGTMRLARSAGCVI